MSDWTRQEAIELSGLSAGRFEVLERTGLLHGSKIGSINRPIVMYSSQQVIAIRAYSKLRERYTMQQLKKSLEKSDFLNVTNLTRAHRLMAWENKIAWVLDNPNSVYTELFEKDNGQFLVSYSVSELIEEIEQDGKTVMDFQERLAVA